MKDKDNKCNWKINVNLTYQSNPETKVNLGTEIDQANAWIVGAILFGSWLVNQLNKSIKEKENKYN